MSDICNENLARAEFFAGEAQLLLSEIADREAMDIDALKVAIRAGELARTALVLRNLADAAIRETVAVPDSEIPPSQMKRINDVVGYLDNNVGRLVPSTELRSLDLGGGNDDAIRARFSVTMRGLKSIPQHAKRLVEAQAGAALRFYGFPDSKIPNGFLPLKIEGAKTQSLVLKPLSEKLEQTVNGAEDGLVASYADNILAFLRQNPGILVRESQLFRLNTDLKSSYRIRKRRFNHAMHLVMQSPDYAADQVGQTGGEHTRDVKKYWYIDDADSVVMPTIELPWPPHTKNNVHTVAPPPRPLPPVHLRSVSSLPEPPRPVRRIVETANVEPMWRMEQLQGGKVALDGRKIGYDLAREVLGVVIDQPEGVTFEQLLHELNTTRKVQADENAVSAALSYINSFLPPAHFKQWSDERITTEDPSERPVRVIRIVRPEPDERSQDVT